MKWSIELVKNKTKELDKEYICLSDEYINNKEKLKFKHLKCNNTFMMAWNDFNNHNYRCPYCKIENRKKTTSQFDKEVKEKFGNDYKVISEYTTNDKYVTILHEKCGNIFNILPRKLSQYKGCSKCNKINTIYETDKLFKKEVYNLVKDEYEVLSNYENCHSKIKFRHNKCNNIFYMEPNNFTSKGYRCPICFGTRLYTIEEVKNIINNLDNDYICLSKEYTGNKDKLLIKHLKCNKTFKSSFNNFTSGNNRCPYCKRSTGEEKISKWLDKNNIDYEIQYSFKDLSYKKPLKFDFKLEFDNGELLLIEFDGIQHFQKFKYEKDNTELEKRKYRDKLKNDYCKKNNIELLRITYKDFNNIELILEEYFKNYL